jgi:tetratricopeptide (TPR) repeat protein
MNEQTNQYNKAVSSDSTESSVIKAAWDFCSLKNHADALSILQEAVKGNPKSFALHIALAGIYDDKQESEKTIEYSSKALRIDPNNSLAHTLLGKAFTRRNQWDKAVSSLNKAITLDLDNQYAYELLGRLVLEVVLNIPPNALEATLQDPVSCINYGPIKVSRELRPAIEYYQRGCKEKWQYLRVYYRMGMFYFHSENKEKLKEQIKVAANKDYGPAQEWIQEMEKENYYGL